VAETIDKITFEVGAAGTDQLVAALAKVDQTLATLGQASARTAESIKPIGPALDELGKKGKGADDSLGGLARTSARSASALNIVGGELARLNPELATVVQSVGRASGAMSGFTGVLGGGAGLVAGGAVAAIGLLIDGLAKAKTAEEELATAVEKTTKALDGQTKSATLAAVASDPVFYGKLAAAGGQTGMTPELLKTRQIELQEKMKPLNDRVLELQRAVAAGARLNRVTTIELQKKQAELDKLRDESQRLSEYSAEAGRPPPTPPPELEKKKKVVKLGHGNSEFMAEMATVEAAETKFRKKQEADLVADDDAILKDRVDAKKKSNEEFAKLNQEKFDQEIHGARAADKELAKLDSQAAKRNAMLRDVSIDAWEAIGSAGIQSLSALVQGQKVSMKAVVASIGDAMVAGGTRAVFEGLAINATPFSFGAGTPLITVGGEEIGAGLAFGAASRLFGGAAGGGGGRQSGPGFYGDRWFDKRPGGAIEPSARLGNDAGAGGNTYIVNQSMLVPTAQAGAAARRAMREADRQGIT
jgi:hypothetical protein